MGVIWHGVIPGDDEMNVVWGMKVGPRVVVLEDHCFQGTPYPAGEQWACTRDAPPTCEPPDHIIAAAMRLTLEGKLSCAD